MVCSTVISCKQGSQTTILFCDLNFEASCILDKWDPDDSVKWVATKHNCSLLQWDMNKGGRRMCVTLKIMPALVFHIVSEYNNCVMQCECTWPQSSKLLQSRGYVAPLSALSNTLCWCLLMCCHCIVTVWCG